MNIPKVNLSILFISMPVCLLADMAPDSFVFIDNYRIGGILLCTVAAFICFLWVLGALAVTILEAFKKKTYHGIHSLLNKILILAAVLCIAGFALWAFRTYGHKKEPKEDPPVIRYNPHMMIQKEFLDLDHDPRD